jgi:LmbE family N-acetylglucosaminyl deacetylase
MAKDVLVVINAHPDDITLVGGTAAKYAKAGHKVFSLSVTLGETVRRPGPEQDRVKLLREAEGKEIAKILGAEFSCLDVPSNKIIPTMEMKMKVMDAVRRLGGNILLSTTPWDVHADHRNLSAVVRDVVYYAGHDGIYGEFPPVKLKASYMFDIELAHNEIHEPDIVIDITDSIDVKLRSVLCKSRTKVFGAESGRVFADEMKTWARKLCSSSGLA